MIVYDDTPTCGRSFGIVLAWLHSYHFIVYILYILMPPQLDVDSSVVSLLVVFLLLLPSLQETNSFVDSLWEAIMKTARKKAGRTITKSRNMESRFSRCIECVVLVCQTRLSTFTIQLGRSLSFMMFFMWVYLYIIVYIVYTYVT